ncbi:hypothetical protein AZE42_08810 [Rhizopogon vesiculosus]|uniref:Heterokaryon incompatibility domain-containing protein n=1 Tax=Rhizopogon vesiculosus TaxID=180088 RepID=A0A1J8QQJ2_9AGAM|nr:hypothetical protein AZE42_08810 [Rhizopogon vesiculosus]
MEVDNFVGAYADTNDHDLKDLIREVFDEYITNEIPIRLLHITEDRSQIRFKLVERIFIKEHFTSVPNEICKEFCGESLEDREDSIREEVKKRLRYAIFSHRWLSKEPSYQDMSKEVQADSTPGWKKLQEFCRKTLHDHRCHFAWCDTCCINKSSSAELDESIRSMFRWYRNSHTCIAFLSETADLEALRRSQTGEGGVNIDQWFLRGWTLQELLAPSQIKFYGAKWQPLISLDISKNDRFDKTIMPIISGITHIPIGDLESFNPGTNRVPEKMLWASKRRTTRIEDIAYCLIGIFDVSLMISYGEGNRAFFRLMEEILKRYDKWDIFLWSGRCSRYNAALPYAPHCYPVGYKEMHVKPREDVATEEERNNANCDVGDRLFALTNHGLQIKVLKLKIELADTGGETNNSRYLTFGYTAKFKMPKVKHIGAKPKASTRWAIGVLDCWISERGKGFLDCRKKPFTAFLLSYDADAPDARWKKAMTEEIIEIASTDHISGDMASLFL